MVGSEAKEESGPIRRKRRNIWKPRGRSLILAPTSHAAYQQWKLCKKRIKVKVEWGCKIFEFLLGAQIPSQKAKVEKCYSTQRPELKSVSLSNSTTAEEPGGLKSILDKICLSFIFNWYLAKQTNLP